MFVLSAMIEVGIFERYVRSPCHVKDKYNDKFATHLTLSELINQVNKLIN